MDKVLKILDLLQATSSRNEKESILKENKDNKVLKDILELTYNPFKIYGIGSKSLTNQLIEGNIYSDEVVLKYNSIGNIFELVQYLLINGTGTDFDKDLTRLFLLKKDELSREWYRRVILKDLKIGVTSTTINKAWKNLIPTFDVQLAKPFEKFYKNMAVEVKIDGVRCLAIKQQGIVRLFTRNGKAILGYDEVIQALTKLPIDNIVFDGEIIGKDYTDTMNQLFSKSMNKKGTYMIFDMLTPSEFYEGESLCDFSTRKNALVALEDIFTKDLPLKIIKPIAYLTNATDSQLAELTDEVVSQGFEGIMLKSLESKYKTKRSLDWQKLKPFMSDEYKIVGFNEGEGLFKGTLGNVLIDVDGVLVGVGSGFTMAQRKDIWGNKEGYLNQIIEVQYQDKIAKSGSLRFPTVKSFRFDK